MWVIQNGALLSLPDDAPLPPNSVKIELPGDFKQNPSSYRIEKSALIRVTAPEPRTPSPRLTPEEIVKIKKAIERGAI
jgi:hypothetical protein